jgi:hypothetical protein
MRSRMRMTLSCVALVLAVAMQSHSAEYETQMNKPVKDVVPSALAAGANYTVKDPVVADGYMYRFTVASTYGSFETTGLGALRKLQREIWAIGELRKITRSEAFLGALKNQAGKPLVFVKDVVTQPADTLTGVPKGVGRLFSNVSTAVTSPRKPSQESRTKEALQVGSFKRDYAARFSVDPYSSNQVLQEELDKLANASAAGLWTASIGTMPISGTAGAVISATSLSKSFNNVLQNEPPARIRTINEEKLAQMGVGATLAKDYLDQPVYTPRQNLILVDSLYRLGTATGRDAYLKAAMAAADEVEANFFVSTAQILRGYHETQGPIKGISMVGLLTVAQTRAGAAVVPFALDYGVWTANADRLSQELKTSYRAAGFNGNFELWVTGALSPTAKQELEARGFRVVEQVASRMEIID